MKKLLLFLSIILLGFTGCGPSQEEKEEKERETKDSIETVKQDTILAKEQINEDSLKIVASKQQMLTQQLNKLNSLYKVECDKLDLVKGHKFLRSKHKKQEQIETQTKIVDKLKMQIQALKKQLQ